jgi:hypothetical protein
VKAEIGRKADQSDHEDAGADAFGAERLLCLENHAAQALGRPTISAAMMTISEMPRRAGRR